MEPNLSKIKNLIREGDLESASQQMLELTSKYSSRFHNEVLGHSANLKQVLTDERKGILSSDTIKRDRNRIMYALLDLTDDLAQELSTKLDQETCTKEEKVLSDKSSQKVREIVFKSSVNQELEVFISYSHKDEDLREELDIHLANLKRQGKITAWHDRAIEGGVEWADEIKENLQLASIILLLISPRFMASDYCYDIEMRQAMERHQTGTARVIPIILKPVDWKDTPFSKLQVLPTDGKPITKWENRDEAFLNVVQGIRRAVDSLKK